MKKSEKHLLIGVLVVGAGVYLLHKMSQQKANNEANFANASGVLSPQNTSATYSPYLPPSYYVASLGMQMLPYWSAMEFYRGKNNKFLITALSVINAQFSYNISNDQRSKLVQYRQAIQAIQNSQKSIPQRNTMPVRTTQPPVASQQVSLRPR